MVLDTSALLAILLGEPEAADFARRIARAPTRLVSTLSALEAAIVISARKGAVGVRELDSLLESAAVSLVSFDPIQGRLAREAYERYGKGRHAAGLNLGDCCSYALAKASGEPLLFKGNDFGQTDVPVEGRERSDR